MLNNNTCKDIQWTPLAPEITALLGAQLHATQLLGKSAAALEAGLCPSETIVDYLGNVKDPALRMVAWQNPHEVSEMCLTIGSGFMTIAATPQGRLLEGIVVANDSEVGLYANGCIDSNVYADTEENGSLNVLVHDFFVEARKRRELLHAAATRTPPLKTSALHRLVRNISSYTTGALHAEPVLTLEMPTVPVFRMAQTLLSLASERADQERRNATDDKPTCQLFATRPDYQASPNGVYFGDGYEGLVALHQPRPVGSLIVVSLVGPTFPSPLAQYRIAPTHIKTLAPSAEMYSRDFFIHSLDTLHGLDEDHAIHELPELELVSSEVRYVRNFITGLLYKRLATE